MACFKNALLLAEEMDRWLRGPELHSQQAHGGSQPSGTLVPEDPTLFWPSEVLYICGTNTYMQEDIHAHK